MHVVRRTASGASEQRDGGVKCNLDRGGISRRTALIGFLMLGVAGPEGADYVDNLDLFHTMEAYLTWYPKEQAA